MPGLTSTPKEAQWLVQQFKKQDASRGCVVGADPMLLDSKQWKDLEKELTSAGHELVEVEHNLVDLVWADQRPPQPSNPITVLQVR